MTDDRKQLLFLALILVSVCAVSVGIALFIEYNEHFKDEEARLVTTVQSQARLLEAVARFDARQSPDYPGGSAEATLSQMVDAHKEYEGLGETGEFIVARCEDDLIVFQEYVP